MTQKFFTKLPAILLLTLVRVGSSWGPPPTTIYVNSDMTITTNYTTNVGLSVVATGIYSPVPTVTFDGSSGGTISGLRDFNTGDGINPIIVYLNGPDGCNTYEGATNVLAGAKLMTQMSAGQTIPSGSQVNLSGGTLEMVVAAGTATFSSNPLALIGSGGTIQTSGGGGVLIVRNISGTNLTIGGGTVGFYYTNSYTGSTTVPSGAILGTSTGILVNTSGLVLSGGTVNFRDYGQDQGTSYGGPISLATGTNSTITSTFNLTLGGNITGQGGLILDGGNQIILTGTNTYTGGTRVNSGTSLSTTTQTIKGNISGGGSVYFTDGTDGSYSGDITLGAGSTLGFSGNTTVTYSGENSISNLQIFGGNLIFGSRTTSFGIIGFNGMGNNYTVTAPASSTTGTTINGGGTGCQLILTGSDTVSSSMNMANSGPLTIDYAGTGRVTLATPVKDPTVSGTTSLTASGGGVLILNSASNTYSGPTTISGGSTMAFSHANSSNYTSGVTLAAGDTLDLSSIAPASTPVFSAGGITASSGGALKISINAAEQSSSINLHNGTVVAPGLNLVLNVLDSTALGSVYTLFENVTTAGSSLSFGNVTGLPVGWTAIPTLGSTTTFVIYKPPPPPPPKPASAGQVGGVSQSAAFGQVTTVTSITGGSRDSGSLDVDSGESTHFTSNPFQAPDLTKDFLNLTDGAVAQTTKENMKKWAKLRGQKTGIWAQPFGMNLRQVANLGAPGFKARTAGIIFGMDHKPRYDIIVGGGLGYAGTQMNCDSNAGKMRINDKFATFFGTWFRDKWYVEGALVAGMENYRGYRNTSANNSANTFVANKHGGYQLTPHVGGGYTFDVKDGYRLKVFGSFDFSYCHQQGYQETGPGALFIKSGDASMLRSQGGVTLAKTYVFESMEWEPAIGLGVVNKKPIKKGVIETGSGTSFESTTVTTTDIAPSLESMVRFTDGYSLGVTYSGEFGSQYSSNQVAVKFTKKF